MFEEKQLTELFQSLGPEQQSEVIDFMERLKRRQSDALPSHSAQHPSQPQEEQPLRLFGSMKGLVKYISDDFDEPLEDFAEYM